MTHTTTDTWQGGLTADLSKILLTEAQIHQRVAELGRTLASEYADKDPLMVGILSGSLLFMADLVRHMNIPLSIDFMAVSSYGDRTTSSGEVRILKDLSNAATGRHIVLVEDIVDSGLTLDYLCDVLRTRHPASLEICTLLDKHEARKRPLQVRHVGFPCPNEFVVGYGLDYAGHYRNLPYIGVLKPAIYTT
ncbi:hypoxanthine phosphoribosyltransferase [Nannocystis pusilla]|uniref:Hypoxanthine phosphoribosyltransferase n=1 Tax=Nannocystis pusilla TaxID=889268 RepID=A0A9X3EWB7_9BACT|nr:hypoxanthine phosphoribosyltransferase [Nannocystis pusilla]MCY1011522.1 hypoxanthine phosphoribosyltransferase [Nannocystis pusilla]